MSQYDNTNRGQIWPNKNKNKDNDPDFTGSLNVDGKEYFLDAWRRKPDANPKAPSLSFRVKEKRAIHDRGMQQARNAVDGTDYYYEQQVKAASAAGRPAPELPEDDIPW